MTKIKFCDILRPILDIDSILDNPPKADFLIQMVSMLRKLFTLPTSQTESGRHVLSLWASRIFELKQIKQIFGFNLVAAIIFTGVVTPEANNLYNQLSIENKIHDTPILADATTQTTFENPLTQFKISQMFSLWHPGLDMTAPLGSPIYAIDEGVVQSIENSFWGYGKNVMIAHGHNLKSHYAHLSEIDTTVGKQVTRGELIGKVGATGWATGNHLHLEIYQNGVPQNPLELLPIKPEEIKYDGIVYQTQTPPSSPPPTINP